MAAALLDADVLVFQRRRRLVEVTLEYRVLDAEGRQVGLVRQEHQSTARKILQAVSQNDKLVPVHLVLSDDRGRQVLALLRGRTLFKSHVGVEDAAGAQVGRIVQRNVFGRKRFDLEAGGTTIGAVLGTDYWAWDFRVEDAAGAEVGQVTRYHVSLTERYSRRDTHILDRSPGIPEPLATLTLAAAIALGLVLQQEGTD